MSMEKSKVVLKEVKKSDCLFLYELLAERGHKINISHKKMPTYKQHIKFVMSKPYSKWYVVYYNDQKIGSTYLSKQDEIGIHIKQNLDAGVHREVLKILMKKNPRKRYLTNINPKNQNAIKFFIGQGFTLIQYTYELIDNGRT